MVISEKVFDHRRIDVRQVVAGEKNKPPLVGAPTMASGALAGFQHHGGLEDNTRGIEKTVTRLGHPKSTCHTPFG